MDFRFGGVFRREEIVEFVLAVDLARVVVTEFLRTLVQRTLDRHKNFRGARDKFFHAHRLLRFYRLIAPADFHRVFLEIAWAYFDAQWHAFLDPFPILYAAADFASINLDFDRKIDIPSLAQLFGEFVANFQHRSAGFVLGRNW